MPKEPKIDHCTQQLKSSWISFKLISQSLVFIVQDGFILPLLSGKKGVNTVPKRRCFFPFCPPYLLMGVAYF